MLSLRVCLSVYRRCHHQCVVSLDHSITLEWPWPTACLQRVTIGTLLLSQWSWPVHLARGRPGWRFHVGPGGRPTETLTSHSWACPSISSWHCSQTAICKITKTVPHDSPGTLILKKNNLKKIFLKFKPGSPHRSCIFFQHQFCGSVAEWLACRTQVQKSLGSHRSHEAVG